MRRQPRLKLPSDVSALLRLEVGERPLAWATGDNGQWYVGTDRAVHLPDEAGFRRLPWEQVERADWQRDSDCLAIVEVAEWGQPETRTEVTVTGPGRLLELLRERVTKSVLCAVFAPVRGRKGLTVVARQSPVGRGPITWSYLLAEGLDPDDPAVAAVADRTLKEAEGELGLR